MKKKYLSLSLLSICILSFSIYMFSGNTYYTHNQYITDFNDDKKVSWFADNMFVWKVIWVEKSVKNNGGLETPINIEVLYNIKWTLEKTIIIYQQWWYDIRNNLIISEWTSIMKEWEIYLIASRWSIWEQIIMSHPNGTHLLTINWDNIMDNIKTNVKVQEFRKAYTEETLYLDNDNILSSGTNTYVDLSKKEKKEFDIFDNGFVKE